MKGICLRGLPGWGEVLAPLTTVVNTFGGTWFTKDWQAQVNSPRVQGGDELLRRPRAQARRDGRLAGRLHRVPEQHAARARWRCGTTRPSAAGSLEDPKSSKVAGKVGYAYAPVTETKCSGWLYTWAWGIEKASKNPDAAWKFVSWASSKEYEQLVGQKLGWARVPAGKRQSLYENPEYQKAAAAFYKMTQGSIAGGRPENPASSRGPPSASSSSTSRSSPSSAPTSRRSSAPRSPARNRSTTP